ncbi:MAG: type VI-B CRISPR-associated RNA-guided ribonuclease Cas13b [Bacteroidales bacterium]|nr:type VI-B CRISPR-associated RNA-guided ribonuclease Cas13b [Bacteroidales bacterium]
MADYIFDYIDPDKTKRYIYGTYIEMAFHNFFITLQHIYKCVKGVYPTVTDDDFGKDDNTVFIFDNLTRAEEQERVKMLLNKHFPFLRVIEDDFNESDKIGIIKKFWEFLKVLRNAAEHDVKIANDLYTNNKADILRWLRTDFGCGNDVKKRGIAIAAKKEMKDRFILPQESLPKSVVFFMNNCNPKSGIFAFRSLVIFVSLFLEGKYTYQFITNSELKANFFYKEKNKAGEVKQIDFKKDDFVNLYRTLSIYNINLPAVKYDAQFDKTNILGLDIINELQKCPHELYEHISKEDQNKFRVQNSDNADYPDEIFLKRFQDRFATLVLRYIDTQKLFKDIRFQVSLGKYRFKFYDKQCIDSDSADRVRILQKELKSFGRLDDMEQKRRTEWADILRISDIENPSEADTADTQPYITDQNARYNIDKHTPKIPLWWDGDCALPVTKDQVNLGQKCQSIVPKAFLSVYDLPAMMFLHLLGGNPEALIKEYYNNYIKFFTDIRDGKLTPDTFSEKDFAQTYKIKLCDVPKQLQNFLLRKKPSVPERYQNMPLRLVKKASLNDFQNATLKVIDEKIEKVISEPQKLKSGRMAVYLAKSIVNLIKNNELKPTGKNYNVMQANLAVYESFDKVKQMFIRSKMADSHPFLKNVLQRSPQRAIDFYKFYLSEEKAFFSNINNCTYLKFYKNRISKYDDKGAAYYKNLAEHYLKNGFVELTNHIFADEIRAKLSGKMADIDANDQKYNISFLISRYYKESQPFYLFNCVFNNEIDDPKTKKHIEKAITRYRIQDKILFAMAKTLLKTQDDVSKAQISDIAEMSLSNIMPGDNIFDKPMQNFSVKVTLDGKQLTINADNIKVKNYSTIFKIIFDRRLDTLAKLITTPQVLLTDITAELELYDREALKINKLIYDFVSLFNAKRFAKNSASPNPLTITEYDFGKINDKAQKKLKLIPNQLETFDYIRAFRNGFAHWAYLHENMLSTASNTVNNRYLNTLCDNMRNQKVLGKKVFELYKELEAALGNKNELIDDIIN